MRGRIKLAPSQFRAAKELLPYENPKLSAVMSARVDAIFTALENGEPVRIQGEGAPWPAWAVIPAPRYIRHRRGG